MAPEEEPSGRVAPPPNIELIVRREKNRVRRWMIATGMLWLITAAYLAALWWAYAAYIHPAFHDSVVRGGADQERMEDLMRAFFILLEAYLAWPVLLFLAAGSTTWFVLASRRATLRQIQASLAGISDQLAALGSRH